jgi:hypothetical protein
MLWLTFLAGLYLGFGICMAKSGVEEGRLIDCNVLQVVVWWSLVILWGPILIYLWIRDEVDDWCAFARGWAAYLRKP